MISEVDLPINDTKNGQVQIFEKSKFSQIVNFRALIGTLLNEIKNAIYMVYSESARLWLSESVKKIIGGQKAPLIQIIISMMTRIFNERC